jgi:hypothetical protein
MNTIAPHDCKKHAQGNEGKPVAKKKKKEQHAIVKRLEFKWKNDIL